MPRTSLSLLTGTMALLCLVLPSVGQLETRASVGILYEPDAIATGDFNRDGAQDIAVVCSQASCGGGVQVLLGHGDGTFGPPVSYAAGEEPENGIAAADLNKDGKLDIVVSDFLGYTVSVLLGNGDGTFQPAISSPAPLGGEAVRVGDFNNDGIPDLALQVVLCPGPCISVLFGNGDGTFQSPITMTLSEYIEDVVVGDFNGDGNLDVIWESSVSVDAHVLLGNGDGTFSPGPVYILYGTGPDSLAIGDLNADGILDLVSTGGYYASVFLGNGDGTFGPNMKFSIAFGGEATRIADMNGDGIPDLVFPSGDTPTTSNIAIVLGRGDGTFGPETFFPSGESGYALAVADFNRDGQPDVAVADEFGNAVTTLLNTGVVAFSPTTTLKFLQQLVGTTSAPQTVNLTNTGTAALGISSTSLSGRGLGMQTSCGQSVAPGGSCKIRVNFHPTALGSVQGSVTLVDTASSKPQVIPVAATATVITLSPTALSFPPQKIGTKSAPMDVTVTNTGSQTVTVTSIAITGQDFTEANTCGTQIGPGASCTISVTFRPVFGGPRTGTLNVSDNGGASPQSVSLEGKGTQ
ncbi:MAG: VCBS repeat-containing protein [Acidobacteriales bacterium]|nr:VCBS repeat-containing protein [Terriglobales bacterium]